MRLLPVSQTKNRQLLILQARKRLWTKLKLILEPVNYLSHSDCVRNE